MCGIAAKLNFDGSPVNEAIFDQYVAQKHRGSEGFGLYDAQEMHLIRTASEEKIVKWLGRYDSNFIVFHHRFPTSTINVARAAHPMSTGKYFGDKQYIMVHNGIIKNSDKLFVAHQELGIEYRTMLQDLTYNDSEGLLWDLALTLEGKQKELKVVGDMAFVLLELYKHKLVKMHFARNSRPLNMYRDKETFELSSEGRGTPIKWNELYSYNYKLKRLTHRPMAFKEYEHEGRKWNGAVTEYGVKGEGQTTFDRNWNWPDSEYIYSEDMDEYPSYDEWLIVNESRRAIQDKIQEVVPVSEMFANHGFVKNPKGIWVAKEPEIVEPAIIDIDEMPEADMRLLMPSMEAVQEETLRYLDKSRGLFEAAYWLVEDEYEIEINKPDTEESIRKSLLMEGVMEYIELDPEYLDRKSISSEWRALCQEASLAS